MSRESGNKLGRKRVSSRAMIEEAACELFLESTYAGATVDEIAQRAGISRNTFFNYFSAKSDVLWASVDDAIGGLEADFAAVDDGMDAVAAVRETLLRAAVRFGPGQVPLAVSQLEVMGTHDELLASGLTRFLRMAQLVERFLAARSAAGARGPVPAHPRTIAFALVAAIAAAGGQWAQAGTARHPLGDYIDPAITPICRGFAVD